MRATISCDVVTKEPCKSGVSEQRQARGLGRMCTSSCILAPPTYASLASSLTMMDIMCAWAVALQELGGLLAQHIP